MYAIEKCKIPGYVGDQRSTSRETHQAHKNRENDLILIMTPEKQDKTKLLQKLLQKIPFKIQQFDLLHASQFFDVKESR